MTFKQLAKEICRREGKKKQVDIAQVSEILWALKDFQPIDVTQALGWQLHVEVVKPKKKD